jgi:hypothetical protein
LSRTIVNQGYINGKSKEEHTKKELNRYLKNQKKIDYDDIELTEIAPKTHKYVAFKEK